MKDKMFKIGDKLLCKSNYSKDNISYHKGKEYIITDLLLNAWVIIEDDERFYYIPDDNNRKIEFRYNDELNIIFYTKNEIRSIKIKKLNNISN